MTQRINTQYSQRVSWLVMWGFMLHIDFQFFPNPDTLFVPWLIWPKLFFGIIQIRSCLENLRAPTFICNERVINFCSNLVPEPIRLHAGMRKAKQILNWPQSDHPHPWPKRRIAPESTHFDFWLALFTGKGSCQNYDHQKSRPGTR